MERLPNSSGCFVCGTREENPQGLAVSIFWDEEARQTVIPIEASSGWCGYHGVIHGGIQVALADDAMAWAIRRGEGIWSVTAHMEATYRRPVKIDSPCRVLGRVVCRRGRKITTEAEIVDDEGEILAQFKALFVQMDEESLRS
ncbi:PaaI family thioesterase [Aminithiophilus ramosus]|uniref:PaaI family thioesterase n=2 Tax=Synergistales TaxID=649776 RepID=A0A9Q7AM19_9BACT|nr:PaaI family thioesterase [Aminithiophilus ramosus]QTX31873.1 PaaI family thioesterase [Aminithiophilus ramosus]QVL35710.1 PaaI family thioesterase [Synergistota bacterium]